MRLSINGNLKLVCTAAGLLVTGAVAWTLLHAQVAEHDRALNARGLIIDGNAKAIERITRDLEWLKSGQDAINAKLDKLIEKGSK